MLNIGLPSHNPIFDQPWWFCLAGAVCLISMFLYGWWCSRNATRWLDERRIPRMPDRLPNGRRPYEWTEEQMSTAERLDTTEHMLRLEEENRQLKDELHRLRDWPPEIVESPEAYRSVVGWRQRALIAERKLEEAYKKLRFLDEELAELRLDQEGIK